MDINEVIKLSQQALDGTGHFKDMRWSKYRDNNKEFKRPDLWTLKMISPAKAIYYPGDEIVNARLDSCSVSRNSWQLKVSEPPRVRGYKPIGAQPSGFVDMSGTATLNFVDKQDYAIELWIKSIRDLISDPVSRFSYPVDLLMSEFELAFHNTVQQRTKIWNLFNAVPNSVQVGDDNPQTGDVSWSPSNSITWAFPWHDENYTTIY